jgi:hypothetical protein
MRNGEVLKRQFREKNSLKQGIERKKLSLIESINPDWKDLSEYLE